MCRTAPHQRCRQAAHTLCWHSVVWWGSVLWTQRWQGIHLVGGQLQGLSWRHQLGWWLACKHWSSTRCCQNILGSWHSWRHLGMFHSKWTQHPSLAGHGGETVKEEREGTKGDRYVTMPRNFCSWEGVSGVGMLWMVATLEGSGCAPSLSQIQPKNLIDGCFMAHFLPLKTCLCYLATCMSVCRHWSCSSSLHPWMMTLSAIPITTSQHSRIWPIIHWKMSWAQARPQGRQTNL